MVRAEWVWRVLIFGVAASVLVVVATRWNRWEGNEQWQSTDDAYLQTDLTPIAAKVAGYVRRWTGLRRRAEYQLGLPESSRAARAQGDRTVLGRVRLGT